MKGNRRGQPQASSQPPPPSPTTKGTAKYTNKDGSKFITVPKIAPTPDPQPSPTTTPPNLNAAAASRLSDGPLDKSADDDAAPAVNRKKAKRRAKAAAKAAAEQATESHTNGGPALGSSSGQVHKGTVHAEEEDSDDDETGTNSAQATIESASGDGHPSNSKLKKSKKKKKKANEDSQLTSQHHTSPPPVSAQPRASGLSREKIWNTSSQEERERIKEFWLGLGEDERKSLVKVEKDAVLKKMKEQQKHTCSCTVCGRKRTAIEEELEGLYDAYYHELEQYAHDPTRSEQGPPLLGGTRAHYSPARNTPHPTYADQQPSHGYMHNDGDDEDDGDGDEDEEYSDAGEYEDEEEDDLSEVEELSPEELHHRNYATDFFNFGKSLTVQGGILTVADDLLKNDGKKFIEMMEQLAERRMAREEDAKDQYARTPEYGHGVNGGYADHDHPPTEEEEYEVDDEEEEEEEYDSQDDDYEDEDPLTDAQRMEEGRRMFQIFAARMFEQRVLTAYREKVAKERQAKLMEEIEEENRQDSQRKAKKAKDALKRKEKAQQKKQALAEEKARKEAEKAAEEERHLAEETRKAEEQRAKAEEKRKKKEAQRKAEEEERLRKEAERLRRIHEQKERQAEIERKAREVKEREKKARDEARLKEQEARERKEREAREKREKQEREAKSKADKEAKDKPRQVAQKSAVPNPVSQIVLPKRPAQQVSTVPALPQQPPTVAAFASPQIPVATPALPKAPTPIKPRQPSQQAASSAGSRAASRSGSGPSQNPSPNPTTPAHSSPGLSGPARHGPPNQGFSSHGQAISPTQTHDVLSSHQPAHFPQIPPPFPHNVPVQPPPGFYAPIGGGNYRAPGPPNLSMVMPPGIPSAASRAFSPVVGPPPGLSQPSHAEQFAGIAPFAHSPKDHIGGVPSPQSRKQSTTFDTGPISRPTPIGRPGSVVHGHSYVSGSPASHRPSDETQDPNSHLGSKALLEDSDFPADDFATRRPMPNYRPAFPLPGPGSFSEGSPFASQSHLWNQPPPQPHAHGGLFGAPTFGAPMPPPGNWGPPASNIPAPFGITPGFAPPSSLSRTTKVRLLLCRACKELAGGALDDPEGTKFVPLDQVKQRVDVLLAQAGETFSASEKDLALLCDTEGSAQNGGGIFEAVMDESPAAAYPSSIRWKPMGPQDLQPPQQFRPPGDIGSPLVGGGNAAALWGPPANVR